MSYVSPISPPRHLVESIFDIDMHDLQAIACRLVNDFDFDF